VTRLPKIVSARLAALGDSEHPDADLLTAFAEDTLGSSERDRVLQHMSGCAECRQIIALAQPELSTESISAPVSGRISWLRTPVLRWGALAACLVVVAATVVIQKREQSPRREVQIALKVPPPAAASQASNPTASMPEGAASRSGAKAKLRRSPALKAGTEPQQLASTNAPANPPNAPVSANAAAADRMQASETVEVQAGAPAIESAPSKKTDQALSAGNSAAPAKSATLFTARPSTETAASTIGGAAKLTDFRPPSWRLSHDDGLPERSFASGEWEKVQVDHKTGFRAIAAHDMEVWVGGPGGLLYHSEDVGLHWTRIIPVSSSAALTQDITAIDFTDHMHGNLHTGDGQTWATSDAGKTWEIQQP
jgi:hypothetical protein